MVCCVELLVLPIPCLKDDEKEPVRKRADWMELVAQRRSTDGIIRVHGIDLLRLPPSYLTISITLKQKQPPEPVY